MKKEWNVTDGNGNNHVIGLNVSGFGGMKVMVDLDTYKAKSANWFIRVLDYQISLPGAECNLVVVGNKIRLAVNGTYVDDGQPYEPVANIPAWVWVLVAISAVGGYFFAGLIGLAVGIALSVLYVKFALDKKYGAVIAVFVVFLVILAALFGLALLVQLG